VSQNVALSIDQLRFSGGKESGPISGSKSGTKLKRASGILSNPERPGSPPPELLN